MDEVQGDTPLTYLGNVIFHPAVTWHQDKCDKKYVIISSLE